MQPEAQSSQMTAPPMQGEPQSPSEPSATHSESSENVSETPIRLIVGNERLAATVSDNPAGRDLLDRLPLTLDFSDYGGQEVLAEFSPPLSTQGMPGAENAPAGTIGYYSPAQAIVLYYEDVPAFSGIMRIGRMDADWSVLEGWADSQPVTIELAE